MQTDIDPRDLIGHKAVDRNGDKIGTVDEVYLDDATGRPEWAAVRTGVFGRDAFVPLNASEFSGDQLRVPYEKSLVKESPDFGAGQHLSPAQELQLYRYYGLDAPGGRPAQGAPHAPDREFGAVPAASPAPDARGTAAEPPHQAYQQQAPAAQAQVQAPQPHAQPQPYAQPQPQPVQEYRPQEARPVETYQPQQTAQAVRPAAEHVHPAPRFAEAPTVQAPAAQAPSVQAPSVQEHPRREQAAAAEQGQVRAAAAPGPSHLDVVCREERVDVGTEWHVLGTARLRKYVVTEEVERRIPVVRERVRVERVPVGEAELAGMSEEDIAEAVEEVTLREERPVVRKRMVPIERVRLVVERVTHEEVVRTQLRREQVKVHDGGDAGAEGRGPAGAAGAPEQAGGRGQGQGQGQAYGHGAAGGPQEPPHVVQYNGSGPVSQRDQPIG